MENRLDLMNFEALNNHLCDVNGVNYCAKDYFENYENGMKTQIKKKLFPDNYKYPTGAQLELTYKCNHRCIHCYNQSGGTHDEKELSIEQWKTIAERLGELGIFQCVISGGEPTILGDGLIEIMEVLDKYNIKFIFWISPIKVDNKASKSIAFSLHFQCQKMLLFLKA